MAEIRNFMTMHRPLPEFVFLSLVLSLPPCLAVPLCWCLRPTLPSLSPVLASFPSLFPCVLHFLAPSFSHSLFTQFCMPPSPLQPVLVCRNVTAIVLLSSCFECLFSPLVIFYVSFLTFLHQWRELFSIVCFFYYYYYHCMCFTRHPFWR